MNTLRLLAAAAAFALAACGSVRSDHPVESSGTPVNPFADPGGANQPSAPLTGAQSQHR